MCVARFPIVLGLLLLITSCGGVDSPSSNITVRDSAGVQIVENPAKDKVLDWQFTEAFAIGRAEDSEVLFDEVAPYQIDVDANGHLFVIQESEHQVAVFDSSGALVRTLGRKGQGPGELSMPTALSVRPSGAVQVLDRKSLVRWNAQGDLLSPRDVPPEFWGPDLVVQQGGRLLFTQLTAPQKGPSEQDLVLHRSDDDPQRLVHLSQPAQSAAEFPSCGFGGVPITPLFVPEIVWDATDEEVVANAGFSYVIDRFEGGKHVQQIRRSISPREATRNLAVKEAGDGMLLEYPKRCRVPPEEVVDGRGFADLVPTIEQITLSPTGQIWGQRYTAGEKSAKIDLFDEEGKYQGTLPGEFPFPVAFLTPNLIVTVESGDVPHIAAYRITQ